jgi:hypothetical protein
VHVRILFLLYCRIVANSSEEMFQIIFSKLKTYLRGKIVEPNVAGGILASMCKSVVQANPQAGLAFFIPYLCSSITRCYGVKIVLIFKQASIFWSEWLKIVLIFRQASGPK